MAREITWSEFIDRLCDCLAAEHDRLERDVARSRKDERAALVCLIAAVEEEANLEVASTVRLSRAPYFGGASNFQR